MQQQGPIPTSVQQARDQLARAQYRTESVLTRARGWVENGVTKASDVLRTYIHTYPPLAAYIISLVLLSAIPLAIYVGFAILTSLGTLAVAFVGFAVVEGTMVLCATGLLLAVLAVIGVCTSIFYAWVAAAYTAFCGARGAWRYLMHTDAARSAADVAMAVQETARRGLGKAADVALGSASKMMPREE